MIKKIKITAERKTIPLGFELEPAQMTVITGENNSGKTNFIKAINESTVVEFCDESGQAVKPKVIYIAAENISPSDDECKASAKTASLFKNLVDLFSDLEVAVDLEAKDKISANITDLIDKTNSNLEKFAGHDQHKLQVNINDKLDVATIIHALIKSIKGLEGGQTRELEDLGQGTQRIIVTSILKAYRDILIEKEIDVEQPVLILFEEPEIYLHPKLKRTLNATLEEIAVQDNHQVIISTHDPYFAFKNFEGDDKVLFSFVKENGITKISPGGVIDGIEDELLFIFLFSLLKNKGEDVTQIVVNDFTARDYFKDNGTIKTPAYSPLEYIRHQIHHLGDNPNTVGLIMDDPTDYTDKNYYTGDELRSTIVAMSKRLGE